MNPMNPDDFRASLLRVERLYSTPPVLAKASRLLSRPEVSLDQVVELIQLDPSLTADVVRISNSAMFSRGEASGGLREAVGRLGFGEVRRVLTLSLSKNVFGKGLANYGVTADEYWQDSVVGALWMAVLARRRGVDPEDAYLIGILHAIGKVLINEVLEDIGWSVFWDGRGPVEDWEREFVGFTHAEAGALLLAHWGFPENVSETIRRQETAPPPTGADVTAELLWVTRLCLAGSGGLPWAAEAPGPFPAELIACAGGESQARETAEEVWREFEAVRSCLAV